MNRFFVVRRNVLALVALGVLGWAVPASAEERDFSVHGTAQFVGGPPNFVGAGNATHMGPYTEVGQAFISGDNPFALDVSGWAILTSHKGDELWVIISGHFNFFTGTITATDTYWGGTGRFEGATGSASLVAQAQPDGTFVVDVVGTIDY